jgi:indole-3-glycerol phosphate synthase
VEEVVKGYEVAGACGISVLTDGKYFGGSLDDLLLLELL